MSGVCRQVRPNPSSLYHLTGHKQVLSMYCKKYTPDCFGANENMLSIEEGNLMIVHRQSVTHTEDGRISAFRQNIDILEPDCAVQFGRQFFKRMQSIAQSSIMTAHFLETNLSAKGVGGRSSALQGDTSEWGMSFRERGISITSQKLEQLTQRMREQSPSPDRLDFPRFLSWKPKKGSKRGSKALSSFRVMEETDSQV